jgi:putative membrane protein insertion efficiency factor
MTTRRSQRRRRKSQDSVGSAIGKGVGKGCADGCTKGCSKALPIVLISAIYFCNNISLRITSLKEFFIKLIREYQMKISPQLHINCFFNPSCSDYAIVAINKYGLFKGLLKAIVRLVKCNPLLISQQSNKTTDFP